MGKVKLFWDPAGVTLDEIGRKKFERVSDGDTPVISMSIRMLSIDTPEVHFPFGSTPPSLDGPLAELAGWIEAGKAPVPDELAEHLHPKLATGKAGTLQLEQGKRATEAFRELLDRRLKRGTRGKRPLYLRTADAPFDRYGRLLAYIAPHYEAKELPALGPADRATFNLNLVESGWAAPLLIYPSLPRFRDLVLLREAARTAFAGKTGAWRDPLSLTGYEFRMCERLWKVTKKLVAGRRLSLVERMSWVERYCVDVTTLEVHDPQDYSKVPPYDRVFVYRQNLNEAVASLNLVPPG